MICGYTITTVTKASSIGIQAKTNKQTRVIHTTLMRTDILHDKAEIRVLAKVEYGIMEREKKRLTIG